MKKRMIVVAGVAVVAIVVALVVSVERRPEWTTRSPRALAELNAAIDAQMKVYASDAKRHLERALQLDPNFVMAKFLLYEQTEMGTTAQRKEFKKFVDSIDLNRLSPRERFMIEMSQASLAGRPEEAGRILDRYLARHPDDPFALNAKGSNLWREGKLDQAKNVFLRLVKIAPNWVVAYNQLGYIAMEQGRFAKSEDYFKTYGFIAPDQANPHDSLGELFILTGRYREALREFNRAITIKPDFCASYMHMAITHLLMGSLDQARADAAAADTQGHCPPHELAMLRCIVKLWPLETAHRWSDILRAAHESGCDTGGSQPSSITVTLDRAAAFSGDMKAAGAFEARAARTLEKVKGSPEESIVRGVLEHMKAMRLAAQGRYDEAAARLRAADSSIPYRGAGNGLFKLVTRLELAEVLRAAGRPAEAARVIASVGKVNPAMARAFNSGAWRPLGLAAHPAS
ncbi:MAG: tetratricopeptide repeat protein [Acidobacteria bacterium]|nr:tetratricopeptide repeat protein [Acidobacteriota bacterium]